MTLRRAAVLAVPFAVLAATLSTMTIAADKPTPPNAQQRKHVTTVHGEKRIDPYFWLRKKQDPKTIAYLKAENDYTAARMKHTDKLQERLFQEFLSRIKETDEQVPVPIDDYFYYSRTEEGKQYSISCRKKGSLDAPEEVILDRNKLAEGHKYLKLGVADVSPNHQLLAYSTDTTGSEVYTLRFKDLRTGELLPDEIPGTATSFEWAADNRTVFYTTRDKANRPYRAYRHVLGTSPENDVLIYEEKDEKFFLGLSKTDSRRFIKIELHSKTSSEVRLLPADEPLGEFRVVEPRTEKLEYSVEHHGDRLLIVTNADGAKNFKLMSAPLDQPGRKHWQELIPHRKEVKLDGVKVFADYWVISQRIGGVPTATVRHVASGKEHRIEFPEPAYSLGLGPNRQYETDTLRFTYTSMVTPRSVFDYHMQTRKRKLLKQQPVLGGYDPSEYKAERIHATAADGTKIPISLVYKKGLKLDGKNPTLLTGYGSYGSSYDPYFSSVRLSLLNRGFVYAIAHVRGGGELGRYWYEEGKLLKKKNTFTDFLACAEHLIEQGYTSSKKLAISGGSAGGLLVGAVINMRPQLFQAAIANVPFVDVVNTMLDPKIPLTVTEYEEWGNPGEEEYYRYIRSYSPYDNVTEQKYPHMLVTAGLNDTRVHYWEPAKWVAKLRDKKQGESWLLLKTNMGAGHGGASGRYDHLKEIALRYAFLLDRLAVKK